MIEHSILREEDLEKEREGAPAQRGVRVCGVEQENGREHILSVKTGRDTHRIALCIALQITLHLLSKRIAC